MTPIVCAWPAVALGRDVAAAAADRERDLEPALRREVRDLELRVQDLEVGGRLDVGGGDRALALGGQPHFDLRRLAVEDADELLQVEDDVGDVLADAGERRELVRDALELDRGDSGALERGEQHAAQRVAERVAEAAVERLDHEDATVLLDVLVGDLRDLEIHNRPIGRFCVGKPSRSFSEPLLCCRARRSAVPAPACRSLRAPATCSTLPVSPSWSAWSHGATAAVRSVASRMTCSAVEPDLSVTMSSGRTP